MRWGQEPRNVGYAFELAFVCTRNRRQKAAFFLQKGIWMARARAVRTRRAGRHAGPAERANRRRAYAVAGFVDVLFIGNIGGEDALQ